MRTEEGKIDLFVAIDRTARFAYVEPHHRAGKINAAEFLRKMIAAVPRKIHTILTDNGIQFTNRKRDRFAFEHIFDRLCQDNGIARRLKTLKGLTPFEYICKVWTNDPSRFRLDPNQLRTGPYI